MKILPGFGRNKLPQEIVRNGLLNGAEIGVDRGEHAKSLLDAGVFSLILVDVWKHQAEGYYDMANTEDLTQANNMRETLIRMNGINGVKFLVGWSHDMSELVQNKSLDFVYIDANHSLDAVRIDLLKWVPKVRHGGWVCGHDFGDTEDLLGFGVKTAVTEHCERNGIEVLFVCQDETFPNWHFVKP